MTTVPTFALPALRRVAQLAALLALSGCIVFVGPGDERENMRDLVAARARWNANGSSDYDMVARALCFCILGGQEVRVAVRGGRVASLVVVSSGQMIDPAQYLQFAPVERLFDVLEEAIEGDAAKLDVTYDSRYGYPVRFQIDYSERIADEEYGHEVVSFTPLTLR